MRIKSVVPGATMADTIEKDMTACTEETTTTSCRDVPKIAYRSKANGAA